MKIKAEPLMSKHVEQLAPRVQAMQGGMGEQMLANPRWAEMMRQGGPAAAFLVDDVTFAISGLIDYPNTGRAVIWAVFSNDMKHCFAAVHKTMTTCLRMFPRRRIEAYVAPDWPAARRLVKAMGFQFEGLMRQFDADGTDKELWALIREGA